MLLLLGLIGVASGLFVLVGAGIGIAGFRLAKQNRDRQEALRQSIVDLGTRVAELTIKVERLERPAAGGAPVASGKAEAPAEPLHTPAAFETIDKPDIAAEAEPPETPQPASAIPAAQPPPSPSATSSETLRETGVSWENAFTSRWLVWLGAVTLALGGTFLVKHGLEQGWFELTPAVRIAFGVVFGVALAIGGEWLRRRPRQRAIAAVRSDYIPAALTGVGLFICYASVYAAHALYGLTSTLATFAGLAALGLAAIALSLLQGPMIALLGVAGGFLTPLLVPSEEPSAWSLFAYLAFLVGPSLWVCRYKGWGWLAWTTLAGASAWLLAWLGRGFGHDEAMPVGGFAVLVLVGILLTVRGRSAYMDRALATAAWAVAAIISFKLMRVDGSGAVSLATLTIVAGIGLHLARRWPELVGLAPAAAAVVIAAMALWQLPASLAEIDPLFDTDGGYVGLTTPVVPPELTVFLSIVAGYAALFAVAGYCLIWGATRPGIWAAVSGGTPVLLLIAAYWRVAAFDVDLVWAAAGLGVAAMAIAAGARVARYRDQVEYVPALAAYAAVAVAALSLSAAMALREAWLTVALALQLPALAWIDKRLDVAALRRLALVVAGAVIVRLVLNPWMVDFEVSSETLWVLYAFGLPATAFFAAARVFGRDRDEHLYSVLVGGALLFVVVLVTLEIHLLATGSLGAPRGPLIEPAVHTLAWLVLACGLAWKGGSVETPALFWGRHLLAAAAVLHAVVVQLLVDNPVWTGMPPGHPPVQLALVLAYAAPALLIWTYAWLAGRTPVRDTLQGPLLIVRLTYWSIGHVFLLTYLLLTSRFLIVGGPMTTATTDVQDLVWYAYSAVLLVYAGGLLVIGILAGHAPSRYASLAVLMVAIAKVFLSDMSTLTGLYRALSFLALGLCLVGIGYVYQRFVFPTPRLSNPRISGAESH